MEKLLLALRRDVRRWVGPVFRQLDGSSPSVNQMASMRRCSVSGIQTSAGARTNMVTKLREPIDGEGLSVQTRVSVNTLQLNFHLQVAPTAIEIDAKLWDLVSKEMGITL